MVDVKTRNALRSSLRRVWHRHPYRIAALKRVEIREYPPNADGTISKKVSVWYVCQECHVRAKQVGTDKHLKIAIDHVNPVIPIDDPDIGLTEFAERLFIEDPLRALCNICHDRKTQEENALRREHKAKLKVKYG